MLARSVCAAGPKRRRVTGSGLRAKLRGMAFLAGLRAGKRQRESEQKREHRIK